MKLLKIAAVGGLVSYLVYFHALLLWQRLADLSQVTPGIALRWLGALALVTLLVVFRRVSPGLLAGKRTTIWLIVLLLHVQAPAPLGAVDAELGQPLGRGVPAVLPLLLSVAAAVLLLATILLAAADSRADRARPGPIRRGFVAGPHRFGEFFSSLYSRPPPAVPVRV